MGAPLVGASVSSFVADVVGASVSSSVTDVVGPSDVVVPAVGDPVPSTNARADTYSRILVLLSLDDDTKL